MRRRLIYSRHKFLSVFVCPQDDFYIDVALLFVIYFVFRISALVWLSVKARKTRA